MSTFEVPQTSQEMLAYKSKFWRTESGIRSILQVCTDQPSRSAHREIDHLMSIENSKGPADIFYGSMDEVPNKEDDPPITSLAMTSVKPRRTASTGHHEMMLQKPCVYRWWCFTFSGVLSFDHKCACHGQTCVKENLWNGFIKRRWHSSSACDKTSTTRLRPAWLATKLWWKDACDWFVLSNDTTERCLCANHPQIWS